MRKISQLSYFCTMQKPFLDYIKKHALIKDDERVLLAVSGGIDSVVLAHLFKSSNLKFGIAHCNFQLRGIDSDNDAVFVKQLALDLDVPFYVKKFETKEHAVANGVSTQMAARELRYNWFHALLETFSYNKIAVAHHKNDNVETLIHNLTRGTSIAGLRGILPVFGKVIRPLLGVSRKELEQYAKTKKIQWREDVSNNHINYKRNFIRHEILPKFEALNPNYLEVINTSMGKNFEVELVFKDRVNKLKESLLRNTNAETVQIALKAIKNEGIGPFLLSEILKSYGINYDQCVQILSMLNGNPGKQFNGVGYVVLIDRAHLIISPKTNAATDDKLITASTAFVQSKGTFTFTKSKADIVIDKNEQSAFLDFGKLKFPLVLRNWKEGDFFMPLGMKGKKKLSDFMIDSKIPLNLKKEQQVILSENNIVWVVGKRIDDRFKVTDKTKRIYIITRKDNNV